MTIPEIRVRLLELAERHNIQELHDLAMQLHRRPAIRKAPADSMPLTPEIERSIRDLACRHPSATYKRIANMAGVNIGRVSEVLAGKRT
jgi:hypothetical protein